MLNYRLSGQLGIGIASFGTGELLFAKVFFTIKIGLPAFLHACPSWIFSTFSMEERPIAGYEGIFAIDMAIYISDIL